MTMLDKVEKEIELACKKENPDWDGKSFDYGCACYQSALKAYKSLCEDDHSGYSWYATANILWRLIHNKPLTPIEDIEETWINDGPLGPFYKEDGSKEYQCKRMSSLFKTVHPDNSVTYHDIDRVIAIDDKGYAFSGSPTYDVNKNYLPPITMPYFPPVNPYKLKYESFCTDGNKQAYDTYAYLELRDPDGKLIFKDKYFKISDNDKSVDISKDEYEQRKQLAKENGYFDE